MLLNAQSAVTQLEPSSPSLFNVEGLLIGNLSLGVLTSSVNQDENALPTSDDKVRKPSKRPIESDLESSPHPLMSAGSYHPTARSAVTLFVEINPQPR